MNTGILDCAYQENIKATYSQSLPPKPFTGLSPSFLYSHTPFNSIVGLPLCPSFSWWFPSKELLWVDPRILFKVNIQCFHIFILHKIMDERHMIISYFLLKTIAHRLELTNDQARSSGWIYIYFFHRGVVLNLDLFFSFFFPAFTLEHRLP